MHSLSIRTKLVMLFSALVAVPLVAAVAWLGITAHRSVLDAGRALTRVADDSLQQSARDVARLTGENAGRSSDELVRIGRQSLNGFARREVQASEQAVRHSAAGLTQTGSAIMQGATERIAAASSAAVNDANTRLRRHQREAIGEVSQTLIGSSRRAFDRVGRDLTAQSEELVLGLARDLNLERSRRTAELVLTFLQNQMEALDQAAQEPRLLSDNSAVANRLLRQLREKHPAALLRTELLQADGTVIAQWPPPLTTPPESSAPAALITAALRTDHTVPSAPQFGPPGTPPTMEIAAAVRGGPGAAARGRRVLAATLSLAMLSDLLAQQAPGQGPQAPILVMTRDGQVLAHSQPANVGIPFSLRRPARMQRVDPYTVMYESASSGPRRVLTHLTEIRGTDGWVVVAMQPLTELLAKTEGLRRTIQATAESAADEMAREANAHAARLEGAAVQEQRRVAAETARQVRSENQAVIRQAVGALVRQQGDSAHRDIERVKSDSRAASEAAALAMTGTARGIAAQSAAKIKSEAVRRAHLGLESMHELATMTAAASAGRIVFEAAGVLLVALIGALLVALLTARSAVRPITALAAGARSIAQGDFSHRVPITSEDELGQLAASFNRMATSIEASRAELQASNAILAQEKRRIQAIVDNSPDGLLILNEDGSVGYANPAARSLLPWQEAAGGNGATPLEAVLPPALLQALDECLHAIDTGRAGVCDLALEAPRRVLQVRSVLLESAGARNAGGVGRLIHLHDVTREREIDELKSNFVMLVSHELRTPLTSILGFSSYMLMGKMGPLTEAQRGGLESIARQAHRLKAIAADFLDLSRIETGQLEIRREPVDLERVARRVLEELDPQAHERGLWLRLAPLDGPATALGDESRITQIFTNLIHNGIKFTEHGGVEVAITPGAEFVRIEVRDTGIGIPVEEQARVFDRFYQVEGVVTRRAGGTGLGLSIVKILVQAHGGEVGVCSSPVPATVAAGHPTPADEGGTTFYFTLPAAKPSLATRR